MKRIFYLLKEMDIERPLKSIEFLEKIEVKKKISKHDNNKCL